MIIVIIRKSRALEKVLMAFTDQINAYERAMLERALLTFEFEEFKDPPDEYPEEKLDDFPLFIVQMISHPCHMIPWYTTGFE